MTLFKSALVLLIKLIKSTLFFLTLAYLFSSISKASPLSIEQFKKKPKLVVVLVVDQLRADYLTRFDSRFLPSRQSQGKIGGYKFLTHEGAYFPFAEYDVLQCMTGPGHAMILSGSYPYQMGIPLNTWYDPKLNQPVYCVQDPSQPLVGAATGMGMSPKNFLGDTVGDELKNAGYDSRVISIALKDRAAILLGGHRADLAVWLDLPSFKWVTSQFYLPSKELPKWIQRQNQSLAQMKGDEYQWTSGKPSTTTHLTLGSEFTHKSMIGSKEVLSLPFGLEITEKIAEEAVNSEHLGQGKNTDILAISFSTHDYLGHQYGPNTLEMEEISIAEDRTLSKFFNFLQKKIPGGLNEVAIVLTADHGVPPSASWLSQQKINAGKIDGDLVKQTIDQHLTLLHGKPKNGTWVPFQSDLNFYFSPDALKEKNLPFETAEREAKEIIKTIPGVKYVFGRNDFEKKNLPPEVFEKSILKTYVPERSGDLIIIPNPYYMIDDDPVAHMTRYTYDRTVPLVFYFPKRFKPGVYPSHTEMIDVAPTLSFLLGILAPATSEGHVISDLFNSR